MGLFDVVVGDAMHAFVDVVDVEVDEETAVFFGELEIGQELLVVDWEYLVD